MGGRTDIGAVQLFRRHVPSMIYPAKALTRHTVPVLYLLFGIFPFSALISHKTHVGYSISKPLPGNEPRPGQDSNPDPGKAGNSIPQKPSKPTMRSQYEQDGSRK